MCRGGVSVVMFWVLLRRAVCYGVTPRGREWMELGDGRVMPIRRRESISL